MGLLRKVRWKLADLLPCFYPLPQECIDVEEALRSVDSDAWRWVAEASIESWALDPRVHPLESAQRSKLRPRLLNMAHAASDSHWLLVIGDDAEDARLTSLPALYVPGDLTIRGLPALKRLPLMRVEGNVHVSNTCSGLFELAENEGGIVVGGNLDLMCLGITRVPRGLQVGRNLLLAGCSQLVAIEAGVAVKGNLDCSHCTSLARVAGPLLVDGSATFKGCTALANVEPGAQVNGSVDIRFCEALRSLPASMVAHVFFTQASPRVTFKVAGSGLTPQAIALVECLARVRGVSVIGRPAGSRPETTAPSSSPGVLPTPTPTPTPAPTPAPTRTTTTTTTAGDFTSLKKAVQFWQEEAGVLGPALPVHIFVEPAYVRGVLSFLSKLRKAKEATVPSLRTGLARRVMEVLQRLVGEEEAVRAELTVYMVESVDTCSDKPVWALSQMAVVARTCEARGDRKALRALALGVMRLEVVHKHVRAALANMAATLSHVDDVCVYMRFEIALRAPLDLPVSALEMLYPSYMSVAHWQIAAAKREALAISDEQLDNWLQGWSEWLRQDRLECATDLRRHLLRQDSALHVVDGSETLLGAGAAGAGQGLDNTADTAVRLKPSTTVCSRDLLLRHWVSTGMDLNGTPRDPHFMTANLVAVAVRTEFTEPKLT